LRCRKKREKRHVPGDGSHGDKEGEKEKIERTIKKRRGKNKNICKHGKGSLFRKKGETSGIRLKSLGGGKWEPAPCKQKIDSADVTRICNWGGGLTTKGFRLVHNGRKDFAVPGKGIKA